MLWVATGSFIGSLGAAGLKAGSKRLERNLPSLFTNWRLAAGVGAYLVSSVFFVFGLKEGELSVLYPLVSLGYMWTLLWSRVFFGEQVTRFKLVGLALILAGVSLLGLGAAAGQEIPAGVPAAQNQNQVAIR
jgi:multidrug transporter EmrE-like cation transporter